MWMAGYYPMSVEDDTNFQNRIEKIKDFLAFFVEDQRGLGNNINDYEIMLVTHYNII